MRIEHAGDSIIQKAFHQHNIPFVNFQTVFGTWQKTIQKKLIIDVESSMLQKMSTSLLPL